MRVRDRMKRDVSTIDENADLSLALQRMLWLDLRHLPVLRGGRVAGVITERDILAARPETAGIYQPMRIRVGEVMSSPVETVPPNLELSTAAAMLAINKIGCLPVEETGYLVGILTTTDLLTDLAQDPVDLPAPEPPTRTRAGDWMSTRVHAVMPDTPLLEAVSRMNRHGIRHLPVIDGLNRVVGILSDRDVRSAVGNPLDALTGSDETSRLQLLHVSHAMTPDPRTVSEETALPSVLHTLVQDRIGTLPVVDDEDRLVGILSYIDVLRAVDHQLSRAPSPS